MDNGRSIYRRI